jgi:hypothetical protein
MSKYSLCSFIRNNLKKNEFQKFKLGNKLQKSCTDLGAKVYGIWNRMEFSAFTLIGQYNLVAVFFLASTVMI